MRTRPHDILNTCLFTGGGKRLYQRDIGKDTRCNNLHGNSGNQHTKDLSHNICNNFPEYMLDLFSIV